MRRDLAVAFSQHPALLPATRLREPRRDRVIANIMIKGVLPETEHAAARLSLVHTTTGAETQRADSGDRRDKAAHRGAAVNRTKRLGRRLLRQRRGLIIVNRAGQRQKPLG